MVSGRPVPLLVWTTVCVTVSAGLPTLYFNGLVAGVATTPIPTAALTVSSITRRRMVLGWSWAGIAAGVFACVCTILLVCVRAWVLFRVASMRAPARCVWGLGACAEWLGLFSALAPCPCAGGCAWVMHGRIVERTGSGCVRRPSFAAGLGAFASQAGAPTVGPSFAGSLDDVRLWSTVQAMPLAASALASATLLLSFDGAAKAGDSALALATAANELQVGPPSPPLPAARSEAG